LIARNLDREDFVDPAIGSYSYAQELNPNDAGSLVSMGKLLEEIGSVDEAIAAYRKATKVNPDDPVARGLLIKAYLNRRKYRIVTPEAQGGKPLLHSIIAPVGLFGAMARSAHWADFGALGIAICAVSIIALAHQKEKWLGTVNGFILPFSLVAGLSAAQIIPWLIFAVILAAAVCLCRQSSDSEGADEIEDDDFGDLKTWKDLTEPEEWLEALSYEFAIHACCGNQEALLVVEEMIPIFEGYIASHPNDEPKASSFALAGLMAVVIKGSAEKSDAAARAIVKALKNPSPPDWGKAIGWLEAPYDIHDTRVVGLRITLLKRVINVIEEENVTAADSIMRKRFAELYCELGNQCNICEFIGQDASEDAIKYSRIATELDETNPLAAYLLGVVYMNKAAAQPKESEEEFKKYIQEAKKYLQLAIARMIKYPENIDDYNQAKLISCYLGIYAIKEYSSQETLEILRILVKASGDFVAPIIDALELTCHRVEKYEEKKQRFASLLKDILQDGFLSKCPEIREKAEKLLSDLSVNPDGALAFSLGAGLAGMFAGSAHLANFGKLAISPQAIDVGLTVFYCAVAALVIFALAGITYINLSKSRPPYEKKIRELIHLLGFDRATASDLIKWAQELRLDKAMQSPRPKSKLLELSRIIKENVKLQEHVLSLLATLIFKGKTGPFALAQLVYVLGNAFGLKVDIVITNSGEVLNLVRLGNKDVFVDLAQEITAEEMPDYEARLFNFDKTYELIPSGAYYKLKDSKHPFLNDYPFIQILDEQAVQAAFHSLRARYRKSQDELLEAIEEYREAITINPHDALSFNDLAALYLEINPPDPQKAIQCLKRAISLNPEDCTFYENLGAAYEMQGEFAKALEAFAKAKEFSPDQEETAEIEQEIEIISSRLYRVFRPDNPGLGRLHSFALPVALYVLANQLNLPTELIGLLSFLSFPLFLAMTKPSGDFDFLLERTKEEAAERRPLDFKEGKESDSGYGDFRRNFIHANQKQFQTQGLAFRLLMEYSKEEGRDKTMRVGQRPREQLLPAQCLSTAMLAIIKFILDNDINNVIFIRTGASPLGHAFQLAAYMVGELDGSYKTKLDSIQQMQVKVTSRLEDMPIEKQIRQYFLTPEENEQQLTDEDWNKLEEAFKKLSPDDQKEILTGLQKTK
ncbi:MAG: tetratricopeptide repeat protein, partial [Candidatus Omnitrophica bacterium]|nr:tetratricopeptide repeat protein [Candidatus Omnitrophota bacterium]